MGSFRIVTGTGYSRLEATSEQALQREFAKLKAAARRAQASKPKVQAKRKSSTPVGAGVAKLYDKIWNDAVRKADKWARETAAEMRASVPVDTGNLIESIHVLEKECYKNKATGEIVMVVGADLDPAGGQGKLYAPPMRKKSERYGRKNPPWQGYRLMPTPPNEYASKFLGEPTIEERFKAIAKKNAKKIMGK